MEEVKQGKKFGSRRLSQEEVEQILPTYSRMLSQIEDMRQSYTQDRKDPSAQEKRPEQLEFVQRINNISVLGKRGCGKTSILKTLRQDLEAQNSSDNKKVKNIILPLIVPENMGESMNLMSTILGLFKPLVAQFAEKDKQNSLYCPTNDEQQLQETYNNLVRSFCYIQPNYHDVVLKDYVSGTKYVQNAAAIFEADVRFEEQFNAFLGALFAQKSYHEDTMLFVFVDDIDLSTHRCTDVVKTLLAYLSHPRIITFISGDLEIFEEALTLEFLRQEKALDTTLLDVTFLKAGSEKSLLKSKQTLSYEYLKKVLPPLYRHHVSAWSIHQRGYFKISQPGDGPALTLATLLTNTFQNYGCATYFQYYDMTEVNTDGKHPLKPIPELFHLFDETARGLNNVYNALLDANKILNCADKGPKQEKEAFIAIKTFLETVVNANPNLNDDRTFLLERLIEFGADFASTIVHVDQFVHVFRETRAATELRSPLDAHDAVRLFTRFLFLDLALLLMCKDRQGDIYEPAKQQCVSLLQENPNISELAANDTLINFQDKQQPSLSTIFQKESFIIILRWYQHLLSIAAKATDSLHSKCVFLSYALLNDCNRDATDSLTKIKMALSVNWAHTSSAYQTVRGSFFPSARKNLLNRLFASSKEGEELGFAEKSCFTYKPTTPFASMLSKSLILNWLDGQISDLLLVDNQVKTIAAFAEGDIISRLEALEQTRFNVIKCVDAYGLWDAPIGRNIQDFIAQSLKTQWKTFHSDRDTHWNIMWDTTFVDAYITFLDCKKGTTKTNAVKAENDFCKIIGSSISTSEELLGKDVSFDDFVSVYAIAHNLVNSTARYGRKECTSICRAMEKMAATCQAPNTELTLYLYYHALIQLVNSDREELYLQNKILSQLAEAIDKMPAFVEKQEQERMAKSLEALKDVLPDLNTLEELFPEGT